MTTRYNHAAEGLYRRMLLYRKVAEQAIEQKSLVELLPSEMWEPDDQAALIEFESARAELTQGRPLFEERIAS